MAAEPVASALPETMAALALQAAERHGPNIAARYLRDGAWTEMTYTELWDRTRALALGLIDLGIEAGDRVAILATTSIDWTRANLAVASIGAITVPVYPTNSPDECHWVIGNSGAKAVVCEDADQVAKVAGVRADLPDLEHVLVMFGEAPDALGVDDVAERSHTADDDVLHARIDASREEDPCLIIYTSGTTGRPKGVVLTNEGFAEGRKVSAEIGLFTEADVIYLYLPLAHVFAQLIQAGALEVGATIGYFGGDTRKIVEELATVQPTVLPSVPRIFEKIYSMAVAMVPDDERDDFDKAVDLGVHVHGARQRGEAVAAELEQALEAANAKMFDLVRSLFGGRLSFAISGAAPIAPEIVRFFYAAGVPVYEGWGMTETTSLGSLNLPHAIKFGTIGRALPGVDMRIADDGEILLRGPVVFREYWANPGATAETMTEDGYLKTGDLGQVDDEGFFTITGRKKDIIITAGGKNLTPANLEGDLRQSPYISQAVMYADRRPYPVAVITLDAEMIVPWAQANDLPTDLAELAGHDDVRALIQAELDKANANYAQVEQIKRFTILDHDFAQETGELTPTLKLKRNVVYDTLADVFADLYA